MVKPNKIVKEIEFILKDLNSGLLLKEDEGFIKDFYPLRIRRGFFAPVPLYHCLLTKNEIILATKTMNLQKKSYPFELFPLREIKNISLETFKEKRLLFLSLFCVFFGILLLLINTFMIPLLQSLHGSDIVIITINNMAILLLQLMPFILFVFSPWSLYLFLRGQTVIRIKLHSMEIIMMGKLKLLGIRIENILFFSGSGTNLRLESKLKSIEELYGIVKDSI